MLEKAVSLGNTGPLYSELRADILAKGKCSKISGFIIGLGGRDITKESIKEVFGSLSKEETACKFIGLKEE